MKPRLVCTTCGAIARREHPPEIDRRNKKHRLLCRTCVLSNHAKDPRRRQPVTTTQDHWPLWMRFNDAERLLRGLPRHWRTPDEHARHAVDNAELAGFFARELAAITRTVHTVPYPAGFTIRDIDPVARTMTVVVDEPIHMVRIVGTINDASEGTTP